MATVRDVMSADLVAVEPTDLVTTAAAIMDAARVGAALVMDHDSLKGIFTERDVLRRSGGSRRWPWNHRSPHG